MEKKRVAFLGMDAEIIEEVMNEYTTITFAFFDTLTSLLDSHKEHSFDVVFTVFNFIDDLDDELLRDISKVLNIVLLATIRQHMEKIVEEKEINLTITDFPKSPETFERLIEKYV